MAHRQQRVVVAWLAAGLVGAGGPGRDAHAQEPPPTVEISDLPLLPEIEGDDERVRSIALAGATEVEEFVVVGASKREQSLGTVASAVTVIPAAQLRRFGYRTLAEALRSVVGLYIVDDRMVERVGIRGVQLLGDANTRILVLIDGSTVNEPWSQYVDTGVALPIDMDDVARVEVIRGPVSSVYGTNAFFGIINIVTIEADKSERMYARTGASSFGRVTGNAGFGVGTVNRQIRGFASWFGRGGETLTYPEFGAGSLGETGADGIDAIKGAAIVHFDRLFFQVRAAQRTRELPGAPYDSVAGSAGNENVDQHILSEIGYTRELGSTLTLATRGYVNRYQQDSALDVDYGAADDGMTGFSSMGTSLWYGGEVRGQWAALAAGLLDVTAGLAAEVTTTESEAYEGQDTAGAARVEKDFSIQGVYSEVSAAPLSWLAATAGVRFDRNSEFKNKLSPRGALFFTRGKSYGLKLLYAQGFRNPSVYEALYDDGARYVPAASALFPEVITSYEVVAWGRPFPGFHVRLSAFRWDLEKIIEKNSVFIGNHPVTMDPINAPRLQFQNNFSGLRSQGGELETSYRDTRGWIGFVNATFATVEESPEFLPEKVENSPVITANVGVSSPLWLDKLHLSTELGYLGERDTREDGVTAAAHVSWNATVFLPNVSGFDVTIGARNLLGQREKIPAQIDYDRLDRTLRVLTVPGAGREFFARVGYPF
jgi:iron complex outermembrane receptor protein